MSRKSIYWGFLFSIILSSLVFILGSERESFTNYPVTVYQVYLNGETIGVIEDEDKLYNLINKEQKSLKNEFKVNKIYAPIGLETTKLVTYEGAVDTVEDVYDKIKDEEPFSVKGYEITIAHSEDKIYKLNVLKKEDFDTAIKNTIKSFVDDETYEKYLANEQEEIVTTGETLENVSIKENITIKEKYLSTDDKIYKDANELSRYLLFGTDEIQGVHTVEAGQTIKEIANKYELNVKEFLIVNPDIKSETALLYPGQKVNIGLVNPVVSIVVETNRVVDAEVTYETETEYDDKIVIGRKYTKQVGQNGTSRVSYYTETINGTPTKVIKMNEEILVPAINEIVVLGGLSSQNIGNTGKWRWPTIKPYVITSYFGWRTDPFDGTRTFHRGLDISGTGYGSPIYAAREGYISAMGYRGDMGNYIDITHSSSINNPSDLKTVYMHLSNFADGIRDGVQVEKGQLIGYMGSTGASTGTHLDFRISVNGEYIDPLSVEYD